MDERWTWYQKQELIAFEGLVYKKVWDLIGYETHCDYQSFHYRGDLLDRVMPSDFSVIYVWSPPRHLGEGEVKTRSLRDAIDLGFLTLVAPVKR